MKIWRGFRILKTGREVPSWVGVFKRWIYGFALLALVFIIIQSGLRWHLPPALALIAAVIDYLVFASFLLDAFINFYYTFPKTEYLKTNWLDLLVFIPFLTNLVTLRSGTGLIIIRNLIVLVKVFTRTRKFSKIIEEIRLNTPQIIALSFVTAILIGTILLTFPAATRDGRGAAFVDALFTATSATCVTGLIVQDTPTYFTTFGQIVILILIQLGGLGIMTFSAFMVLLLGRFSLGQRRMIQEMMEEEKNVLNMIIYIFKMTFFIELAGCVVLFIRWIFYFPEPIQALYFSIFHAVSAFCNAGFSLFSDSLVSFVADPVINCVIMALIILGGLGFIVVYELSTKIRSRKYQLSVHTRLVVLTSLVLTIVGFLLIFFLEFDNSLMNYPLGAKFWASLFQAVTPRTAGFNTVAIPSLSMVTLTIIILFMFIGASPGSTGGGIKTTTFTILLLSLKSILKGRSDIELFKRTIPSAVVYKALALVVSSLMILVAVFLLLLAFEAKPFLAVLFEAVSAFGTVGLSTGITSDLTIVGKLLIICLMYAGRIGPLTLGLALARALARGRIVYPEAKVFIG